MTSRQKQTLDYIKWYWGNRGYAPSYDEIAANLGLASKSNVHKLVKSLVDRGFVVYLPYRARSVRLADQI